MPISKFRAITTNLKGFTLIELLVVMAIMAIIGIYILINFSDSREEQLLQKELLQLQSTLKLAQSNASASVFCNENEAGALWQVEVNPTAKTVNLSCFKKGDEEDKTSKKSYTLEPGVNASFSCPGSTSEFSSTVTVTVTYTPYSGLPKFSGADTCGTNLTGLSVILRSEQDETLFKQFTISTGGAVNAK